MKLLRTWFVPAVFWVVRDILRQAGIEAFKVVLAKPCRPQN